MALDDPIAHLCLRCLRQWQAPALADRLPYSPRDPSCPHCFAVRVVCHPTLHQLRHGHFDCDAFFAAVAKREHPELNAKPVIIGRVGQRSVVATCCYVARMFGVRSAMPMQRALKLCPHAQVLSMPGEAYRQTSRAIRRLLRDQGAEVEGFSLDEGAALFPEQAQPSPAVALAHFAGKVSEELKISVSIGLADNFFLAKFASDFDKPKGFVVVSENEAPRLLADRPVADLRGVGPASRTRLNRDGIYHIKQLQNLSQEVLINRYGRFGEALFARARGWGRTAMRVAAPPKSVSNERTFPFNVTDLAELAETLNQLALRVSNRLQNHHLQARKVILKLRTPDFKTVTRTKTLTAPISAADVLAGHALEILDKQPKAAYRLIGLGTTDLYPETTGSFEQATLPCLEEPATNGRSKKHTDSPSS